MEGRVSEWTLVDGAGRCGGEGGISYGWWDATLVEWRQPISGGRLLVMIGGHPYMVGGSP